MTIGGLVAFSTYLSKLLIAISKILDININKQAVNISYQRISSLLEKNIYPKEEKYIEKLIKFRLTVYLLVIIKNVY